MARSMIRTESDRFVQLFGDGKGFDVGDVPARVMLDVIRPVRQQSDPLALQQGFSDMAKVALGVYNENQGTRYQFFQVIKALTTPGRLGSEDNVKVEFCRVESKPELSED